MRMEGGVEGWKVTGAPISLPFLQLPQHDCKRRRESQMVFGQTLLQTLYRVPMTVYRVPMTEQGINDCTGYQWLCTGYRCSATLQVRRDWQVATGENVPKWKRTVGCLNKPRYFCIFFPWRVSQMICSGLAISPAARDRPATADMLAPRTWARAAGHPGLSPAQ